MPAAIVRSLRERTVLEDHAFDRVFPSRHLFRSWLHWTPVDVALRATALLAPGPDHSVLDVGSGVGKLCLVGAVTTSATWVGIERDARMVSAAAAAAATLQVDQRTHFIHGDISAVDWTIFNAFYLYNPFGEILLEDPADTRSRLGDYAANVAFVEHQLARVALHTRVVTYHGFGGEMPPGFDCVHRERAREDALCLWIKHR